MFAVTGPALSQQMEMEGSLADHWYSVIEIPALLAAVVFGFLTARALRGGRLGVGMQLIAWGFLEPNAEGIGTQNIVLLVINVIGVYRYLIRKKSSQIPTP